MSQKKRNNILFIIFLLIVILSAILITYILIRKNNSTKTPIENKNNNTNTTIPTKNLNDEFNFKKVTKSDTINVYKKYNKNAIDIKVTKDRVSISGLKDKAIENKVNEKLKILKPYKNYEGNNECIEDFNMSNVLSMHCGHKYVNIDLTTGNEISLEEAFNEDTDIINLLRKNIYKSIVNYAEGSSIEGIEEKTEKMLNTIKEGKYNFYLDNYGISFEYNPPLSEYDYGAENMMFDIRLFDEKDNLTYYDRFETTESIYEKESLENIYIMNINEYNKNKFLTDKSFIEYTATYNTCEKLDWSGNCNFKEVPKELQDLLLNEIVRKNKLDNDYTYSYIDITLNEREFGYTTAIVEISKITSDKDLFERILLGYNVPKEQITYANMIIKDGKISYLDDNPDNYFVNFSSTLYDLMLDLGKQEETNVYFEKNICENTYSYEGQKDKLKICQENFSRENLSKTLRFAIDKANQYLYAYYTETYSGGIAIGISRRLPWNAFTSKESLGT